MRFLSSPASFSILALIALTACATDTESPTCTGATRSPNGDDGITVTDQLPAGSFRRDDTGFSGDLFVRGYPEIERVREPFCESDCETFDYVFFRVTETGSAELADYLRQLKGNAYVRDEAIGLGCTEDGVLRFFNASDERGMREQTLGADTAARILDAREDAPVTLYLQKLPFTGGSEAPACYSHFSSIRLRNT